MERDHTLTEKVIERLQQHQNTLAGAQRQLDSRMNELLKLREHLRSVATDKIETLILPRMEVLARQFDNAGIDVLNTEAGYACICKFTHTPRFPATVNLGITLLFGNGEHLTARYDLNILPVLMEYTRNYDKVFSLEDDDSLANWVEDRILDFLDTYLQLETHPLYQKDNTVIDIVCGMRISSVSAASTVNHHGETFYFCSDHCKEDFLNKNS